MKRAITKDFIVDPKEFLGYSNTLYQAIQAEDVEDIDLILMSPIDLSRVSRDVYSRWQIRGDEKALNRQLMVDNIVSRVPLLASRAVQKGLIIFIMDEG